MAEVSEIDSLDLNRHFGIAVRRLREQRQLSQEQLAERADLNRSFVGEIERGLASPSLLTVTKLAQALQVSTAALVAHCETPQSGRNPPDDGYSLLNAATRADRLNTFSR